MGSFAVPPARTHARTPRTPRTSRTSRTHHARTHARGPAEGFRSPRGWGELISDDHGVPHAAPRAWIGEGTLKDSSASCVHKEPPTPGQDPCAAPARVKAHAHRAAKRPRLRRGRRVVLPGRGLAPLLKAFLPATPSGSPRSWGPGGCPPRVRWTLQPSFQASRSSSLDAGSFS